MRASNYEEHLYEKLASHVILSFKDMLSSGLARSWLAMYLDSCTLDVANEIKYICAG